MRRLHSQEIDKILKRYSEFNEDIYIKKENGKTEVIRKIIERRP